MKAFHYAIASIVDANTSFGLHRDASVSGYRAAEQHGREIRAKSTINLLASIGRGLAAIPAALRTYNERKRKIREISALTDRQLDDIGLSRGDIVALQYGMIDLTELESLRIENLGSKRVQLPRAASARHEAPRHAVNEAVFARAKCA